MKKILTKDLLKFSKENLMPSISDRRRWLEIGAVIFTAIGKFVFMDFLNWRLLFVVLAIISWGFYIVYRYRQEKSVLKYWGFRIDNFKQVFILMLPFGMLSIIAFSGIGYYQKTINMTWHILPLLITYPIWGSIQQFLTIWLMLGTFVLALFYGFIYLKQKNIYAMGIFQGWLGHCFIIRL